MKESQRNAVIEYMSEAGIGVNVHYKPLPLLTLFRSLGYNPEDYPSAMELYENEITLPVYNGLSLDDAVRAAETLSKAHQQLSQS